jgi:hypothetical protein
MPDWVPDPVETAEAGKWPLRLLTAPGYFQAHTAFSGVGFLRIVTNARGGFSNHNFGIAFDVGVFEGASYLGESPKYKAVGALGMDLGLEWGGNWKTFVDEPHFQLRPKWAGDMKERDMVAELRTRKDAGKGAYAENRNTGILPGRK